LGVGEDVWGAAKFFPEGRKFGEGGSWGVFRQSV
jgi:hypothetical protein